MLLLFNLDVVQPACLTCPASQMAPCSSPASTELLLRSGQVLLNQKILAALCIATAAIPCSGVFRCFCTKAYV
jgi:hypothetical protein